MSAKSLVSTTPTESIRSSREFRHIYSHGRRGRSNGVSAFVILEPGTGRRVGLTVGKAHGGAVVRNRVRRRLKAAAAAASLPPGMAVVLRVDPDPVIPFQELVIHVKTAVTRAAA